MGRHKPVAKRRRVDEDEAQQKAIETLSSVPIEQVEAAAALATRESCQHWPKINNKDESSSSSSSSNSDADNLPDWLSGLGVATTLPNKHLQALTALHELIKQKANTLASWSGSEEDPRKRAFGFLPETLGYDAEIRDKLDISTPWRNDGGEERTRNNQAMVVLEAEKDDDSSSLPDGVKEAIDFLCETFREQIKSVEDHSSSLKTYLQYRNLIAAQPNLHCGRELLPSHVDHPGKDGFGIVIVTICIVGSGTIFLQDYTDQKKATMQVCQGQAYMLSGKARDACHHGVITLEGNRESLNLRFGLHDLSRGDKHPSMSSDDVLRFWSSW